MTAAWGDHNASHKGSHLGASVETRVEILVLRARGRGQVFMAMVVNDVRLRVAR